MTSNRPPLDLAALLAAVEDAPPVAAADVVGAQLGEALGASDVALLIADFSGYMLTRLGYTCHDATTAADGRETSESVPLAGTPHGRALATQSLVVEEQGEGVRLLAPVTNRGEAIGVLEVYLPAPPDERAMSDVALAAHALAYILIANRRFTDLFVWGQRSVPLSLAAEIQHRLLPGAYSCEAGQFTLAAWLEPAGEVGGDTFDFAMDRDTLHLSISDAMGHTVNAAVLATVVVGALRNARRVGASLEEQAERANRGIGEHMETGEFVTGQLVRIDLVAAALTLVNAGHPAPLRLRDGRVERLSLEVDPPFGIVAGHDYRVQEVSLMPGDRLLFVTDGMLERKAAGADLGVLLEQSAHMHPREAVQHIVQATLTAAGGDLRDDATAMCVDWHGGPPRERESSGGSNN